MKKILLPALIFLSATGWSQSSSIETKSANGFQASVGGKRGGTIQKGALKAQGGVGCYFIGEGFEFPCAVTGFTVTIWRDKESTFSYTATGNLFNSEIRNAFNSLKNNDRVLFSEITGKAGDNKIKLASLEFIIDK